MACLPTAFCIVGASMSTALRETGYTADVEGYYGTLRQRLARFVRQTISFSKSVMMHEACVCLFLHLYNCYRAAILT